MSYGMEWSYARGFFYTTPDNILHIRKSMPEDVKARFLIEAAEARKRTREQNYAGRWTSADFDYDTIIFDEK